MDGDEIFALVASFIIAVHGSFRWLRAVNCFHQKRDATVPQFLLLLTAPVSLMLLVVVLKFTAAREVRDEPQYLLLFTVAGAAWLTAASELMLFVGVDLTGDAVHRGNSASAIAGIGAFLGIIVSYGGANAGEGATIWTTFYPACISLLAIFAVWLAVQWVGNVAYSISIDRDLASGFRLGGLLLACGIIFAKAGAGDWVSADATLRDYVRLGWPAIPIAAAIAILQRWLRPTPANPRSNVFIDGVLPAVAANLFALLWFLRGHR